MRHQRSIRFVASACESNMYLDSHNVSNSCPTFLQPLLLKTLMTGQDVEEVINFIFVENGHLRVAFGTRDGMEIVLLERGRGERWIGRRRGGWNGCGGGWRRGRSVLFLLSFFAIVFRVVKNLKGMRLELTSPIGQRCVL